jgi:agmatine deiminase
MNGRVRALMPGEFEPHERTVICWPTRREIYPGALFGEAEEAHALVARTIAGFEPVTMIADTGAGERAQEMCGGTVEVVEIPIDDSWFRDTGPIYVRRGGELVALDFLFNGWGEKFEPWDADADVASRWIDHGGHRRRAVPVVLEGGSLSVDGAGTLVTTTQCLMHPNRNPSMTQRDVEQVLAEELGAERVLWLPYGLALDDDTDGHVDNVAAFARPGLLVVQGCEEEEEEDDWLRLHVDRRCADGAVDARGEPIEVVEVPVLPFVERDGVRAAVPYLNYYVGNGFVAVPVCGHAADSDMVALIGEQYPGRRTIALDVGAILAIGGGGIHCITQQVPVLDRADGSVPVLGDDRSST